MKSGSLLLLEAAVRALRMLSLGRGGCDVVQAGSFVKSDQCVLNTHIVFSVCVLLCILCIFLMHYRAALTGGSRSVMLMLVL